MALSVTIERLFAGRLTSGREFIGYISYYYPKKKKLIKLSNKGE